MKRYPARQIARIMAESRATLKRLESAPSQQPSAIAGTPELRKKLPWRRKIKLSNWNLRADPGTGGQYWQFRR
jgi:hypothetical protein